MSPLQLMERGQWVGKIQQLLIARSKERVARAREKALREAIVEDDAYANYGRKLGHPQL